SKLALKGEEIVGQGQGRDIVAQPLQGPHDVPDHPPQVGHARAVFWQLRVASRIGVVDQCDVQSFHNPRAQEIVSGKVARTAVPSQPECHAFSGSVMLLGSRAAFSSASRTESLVSFFLRVPARIFSKHSSRTVFPLLNASLATAAAAS